MANVIREDVIKLGFDINTKELEALRKDVDALKKIVMGGVGDKEFDKLGNSAKEASKGVETLKKASSKAYAGVKKLAGISFKALSAGVSAAATGIGAIVTKSVKAYADYEQLVGGVDTLFKDSSKEVQKYANDAYKTAGLSANEYMETATSFAASLLQSLGGDTKQAAKYADMAVSDMADNANKMGTDMGSIQWAYQGFAKQNYTINYLMSAA